MSNIAKVFFTFCKKLKINTTTIEQNVNIFVFMNIYHMKEYYLLHTSVPLAILRTEIRNT